MPYNILTFITRRPGMSQSDFRTHYECAHIPMLRYYGGEHFPRIHRRHYAPFSPNFRSTILQNFTIAPDVDAIAEISFDDEAAFQTFMARLTVKEVSRVIRKDEEKFVDPQKVKIFVVGDVVKSETSIRKKPFSVDALLN